MDPGGSNSFGSEDIIVARIVNYSRVVASMTSVEPRRKPVPRSASGKPGEAGTSKRPRRRPVAMTSV